MSLINDALKQARKTPPRGTPHPLPPLQPVAAAPPSVAGWLIPAIVIVLMFAAVFFIGWAVAHHSVRSIVTAPKPVAAAPLVAEAALPAATPPPEPPPPSPPPPMPLNPPDAPRLQGVFYSPTAPSAIVDGKTVRPGDHLMQYRVKGITKDTVILVGPDGKAIQLGMSN